MKYCSEDVETVYADHVLCGGHTGALMAGAGMTTEPKQNRGRGRYGQPGRIGTFLENSRIGAAAEFSIQHVHVNTISSTTAQRRW